MKPLSPCWLGEWPRMDTCGPGRWQGGGHPGGTVAWPHLGPAGLLETGHPWAGTLPWVPLPNPPGSQCPPSPMWGQGAAGGGCWPPG